MRQALAHTSDEKAACKSNSLGQLMAKWSRHQHAKGPAPVPRPSNHTKYPATLKDFVLAERLILRYVEVLQIVGKDVVVRFPGVRATKILVTFWFALEYVPNDCTSTSVQL